MRINEMSNSERHDNHVRTESNAWEFTPVFDDFTLKNNTCRFNKTFSQVYKQVLRNIERLQIIARTTYYVNRILLLVVKRLEMNLWIQLYNPTYGSVSNNIFE